MVSIHIEEEVQDRYTTLPPVDNLCSWLTLQIQEQQVALGELQYILTSDDHVLELNKTYLNHDYLTDILTFPYDYQPINGEIYISLDRVADNASEHKVSFEHELLRVLAHGALHMLKYDDHDEKDKLIMRQQEDLWMNKYIELHGLR